MLNSLTDILMVYFIFLLFVRVLVKGCLFWPLLFFDIVPKIKIVIEVLEP